MPYTRSALIYQEVIEKPPFTPVYVESVLVTDGIDGWEEHVQSYWYHEGKPKSLKGPFGSAAMARRRIQAARAKRKNPPPKGNPKKKGKAPRRFSVRFRSTSGYWNLWKDPAGGHFYTDLTLTEAKREAGREDRQGYLTAVFDGSSLVWQPR